MATKLGVGDEVDVQHAGVDAVRWLAAKLIAPQPMRLLRRPLVPREADHIRAFAGPGGKLEVAVDALLEIT